jgi:predicted nucleic acid-binding protein
VVVDASIALSWCFREEAAPATDAIYGRVRDTGAIVPGIWHLELGNALLQAEKRGRITEGSVSGRLELFRQLPIVTDAETTARAWHETLVLAKAEGLTTYDACYLELALRLGVTLASKDDALRGVASRLGVPILP